MGRRRERLETIRFIIDKARKPGRAFCIWASHTIRWYIVSTPDETFRGTLATLTPDGDPASLIVTWQGLGSKGRVWVTFSGAWVTTAVMTDGEAEEFVRPVGEARERR